MSSHQTPPNSNHPDLHRQADDSEYYRRILHNLIDIGVDIAQHIHNQATAPLKPGAPPRTPSANQVAAFERVARAVRRTIILAHHLAQFPESKVEGTPNPVQRQRHSEPDEHKLKSHALRPRYPLH